MNVVYKEICKARKKCVKMDGICNLEKHEAHTGMCLEDFFKASPVKPEMTYEVIKSGVCGCSL
jgi:hypothetical protein